MCQITRESFSLHLTNRRPRTGNTRTRLCPGWAETGRWPSWPVLQRYLIKVVMVTIFMVTHHGLCAALGLTDAEVATLAGIALSGLEIVQRLVEDWVIGERHDAPHSN